MSGSKSKAKGARGERELCDKLAATFGGSFIRSNNSGAFVGGKNVHRKATLSESQLLGLKSDIVPPDHMPRLVVECKLYKEIPYHGFFSGAPIALIDGWIDQIKVTIDDGDFWALVFRADRRPWSILIPVNDRIDPNVCDFAMKYTSDATYWIFHLDEFLLKYKEIILEETK